MKLYITIFFIIASKILLAQDSIILECKYNFSKLKDSTNMDSKFNDVMILSVSQKKSTYYSYLKQFGNSNLENDVFFKKLDANQIARNGGNYFTKNETEIIVKDLKKKKVKVFDELTKENCYTYIDSLSKPKWTLLKDTQTILGYKCQNAKTFFKGRHFEAWFTQEINISEGPWLFWGLPGLILKVNDEKNQFQFVCTSLAPILEESKYFRIYSDCTNTKKSTLSNLKKFKAQDPIKFMETTTGKTVTQIGVNGAAIQRVVKPYNPIDLTNE